MSGHLLILACVLTVSLLVVNPAPARGGALVAGRLRCEHLVDPLGIDRPTPRMGWELASAERGAVQSAYQIVAGADAAAVSRGEGELWDSGRVASDRTIDVVYAGRPLGSHQFVYWSVRAWDGEGNSSAWAAPASFSTGFLTPAEWTAAWVGFDTPRAALEAAENPLAGASWIGFAGDPPSDAPKRERYYAASFEVPAAEFRAAVLHITADDHFSCAINGREVGSSAGKDAWRTVREIDVRPALKGGRNEVRVRVENAKPGPAGLLARLVVTLTDGRTVDLPTGGRWTCSDRPDKAGPAAQVIGPNGVAPWGKLGAGANFLPPAVLLRGTFAVNKPVRRAVLYATALGIADTYLNGERVSEDRFTPGWTDYHKRVYYRAYDVTSRVKRGENAMGAELADGWFSGYVGYGHVRDSYGKYPRYAAELRIEYADGTAELIKTGPGWRSTVSPTREADLLMGETFDARKKPAGWSASGFDAAKWTAVHAGAEVRPAVRWHPSQPVVAYEEFVPVKTAEPTPGVYVLDLGQNFAGVARLRLEDATPGQKITLRYAERVNPDGALYTANLRAARATDTYTCRGGAAETWEPRFTYHGFQYVEVTGLTAPPKSDTITGVALSSATPIVGAFETSDPMLNRLRSNIYYTQRSNFIDVPTDCPQRDERLGWTADAQVYLNAAILVADVQPFFDKWLLDLADAQRGDGQFPRVAPMKTGEDDGGPGWADAGVICPWVVYEAYGDKALLARQYPSMRRFIDFCTERSGSNLKPPAQFHAFGDWLNVDDDTPKGMIYLLYYAYSTDLCSKAARALGREAEADELHALFGRIKQSFHDSFVSPDGRITGDSQAAYVMAIRYGLVDGKDRAAAARHLVQNIERHDDHLATGFLGTKELMLVLSDIDRQDVAFKLVHNTTYPSWGFEIRNGATSIWERWDGWTPEKGFQTPTMNSFSHYSFGAVYQWMAESIGGIHASTGAAKSIVIAPQIDPNLQWAKVGYHSPRGGIATSWKREGGRLALEITVPANVRATVRIPAKAGEITESGKPLNEAEGVTVGPRAADAAEVEVGSGTYHFDSPWE